MSHTKIKDWKRVRERAKSREPLRGPAGQLVKYGQLKMSRGMDGYPTPLTMDPSQAGGTCQMVVRFHKMQGPAHQKLQAVAYG